MASADDYETWAATLRTRSDEVSDLVRDLVAAFNVVPRPVTGGQLGVTVARAVEAADVAGGDIATALAGLGDECVDRAEICRQHAAAIAQYELEFSAWRVQRRHDVLAGTDTAGPPPERPVPPAPWVED